MTEILNRKQELEVTEKVLRSAGSQLPESLKIELLQLQNAQKERMIEFLIRQKHVEALRLEEKELLRPKKARKAQKAINSAVLAAMELF